MSEKHPKETRFNSIFVSGEALEVSATNLYGRSKSDEAWMPQVSVGWFG